MKRRRSVFHSEAELCDAFASDAARIGLRTYPEVEGWDLLLILPIDRVEFLASERVETEIQVGIEAKLRPGIDVVSQALYRMERPKRRPHAAAILVPEASRALVEVCRAVRLSAWSLSTWRSVDRVFVRPWTDDGAALEVPRFEVPHLRAGQPSPRPLTKWRESAIRLCLRLRDRGFVTSLDFRELAISPRWWTENGVLRREGEEGRRRRYVVADATKLPDVGWESVAAQIAAETRGVA